MTKSKPPKPPKALDEMVKVVLGYRPKPKTKPARRRKRMAAQIAKVANAAMAIWLNPPKGRPATDAEVRYIAKAFGVPVSKVRPK